jgi:MoaA/NifB/PqqE/SkfB family radical SAM enzyme
MHNRGENTLSKNKALLDRSISGLFWDALRISLRNPSNAFFLMRLLLRQNKAQKIRKGLTKKGFSVPAFLIISITNRCNLHCKSCYAREQKRTLEKEMGADLLLKTVKEASSIGVSFILLAGGEPMLRKQEILGLAKSNKNIVFPLFTNGLLFEESFVSQIKRLSNIVPVISIEGNQKLTNQRRGEGVFESARSLMEHLGKNQIFYGVSITVTKNNFTEVTDRKFIEGIIESGCRLFFFVEYVPVEAGTENLEIDQEQRKSLMKFMAFARNKYKALFIAFPGDEEMFGGCLAAGRGFAHISPSGRVEPCPFAPYSDVRLEKSSLLEALQSSLLKEIRDHHEELKETEGGCALWKKREWVSGLANKN